MSMHTMVRAIVPTVVAEAARAKAESQGLTLADAVAELLAQYVEEPASKPKPKPKKPRARSAAPARKG